MHTINEIHPTIKFIHEIRDTELTFLDVTLYKGDRFLHTNILDLRTHIKDTNSYIMFMQPPTIKAIRKNETNFNRMTCKLIHKLKQRRYKQSQIVYHIKDIKFDRRKRALTRKQKPHVFVTQYNKH